MKQILMTLIAVMLFAVSASAQYKYQPFTYAVAGDDTATNSDAITLLSTARSSDYDLMAKLTITKVSGTVGGTAVLYGSVDNVTWFVLESIETGTTSGQFVADTATVANGTADYWWSVPDHKFEYYKFVYTSTGTQVSAPTARLYYRKSDN